MTNYTRLHLFAGRAASGPALVAIALAALLAAILVAPAAALAADDLDAAPAQQIAQPQIEDNLSGDPESNLPYLFAVFIITWALFFAYVIYMALKQRRMQSEIEALTAMLTEKAELPATDVGMNDEAGP